MKALNFKRIITSLGVIVGCVLCGLLGFFVAGSIGIDASENKTEDVDWITLGEPPLKIDHLLFVDPYSVFVKTRDGEVFKRYVECESEPCWTVSALPDPGTTSWVVENLVIAETCQFQGETIAPPGIVVECASLNNLMMVGGDLTAYYALLDDGSVSLWMRGAYDIDYGIQLFALFTYGILGAVVSIILYGISILSLYTIHRILNRRDENLSV